MAWDTQPPRSETVISDTEEVFSKSPHTMLLDDGNDEKVSEFDQLPKCGNMHDVNLIRKVYRI